MNIARIIVSVWVACLTVVASAGLKMGTPFSDHMVLQRERKVPVWGWAAPGERVTVKFAGQEKSVKADSKGKWTVELDPLKMSKVPQTMKVNDLEIKDILVGEVWLVSGQSNTELPLWGSSARFRDRQGALVAQITRRPMIRYAYACEYDVHKLSTVPLEQATRKVEWKPFTPENLSRSPSFSAMAVYFARDLEDVLDMPIGLVGAYWGGTNIDAWTPHSGYDNHPELAETRDYKLVDWDTWEAERRATSKMPICEGNQQPSILWNTMWAPWVPFASRGLIWYQGCHNHAEGESYCNKMHALYDGWSKEFQNPDFKLYFAQLAPYNFPKNWFRIRLGQDRFAAEEKNAGMVVTCDVGNFDDIHPADKEPIGRRLALLALNRDYGFTDIVADSPRAVAVKREGSDLVVDVANATSLYVYADDFSAPYGMFEVAGTNAHWYAATLVNAKIDRMYGGVSTCQGGISRVDGKVKLVVGSAAVKEPVMVRYLQHSPWKGTIFNQVCLPLGPFELFTPEFAATIKNRK